MSDRLNTVLDQLRGAAAGCMAARSNLQALHDSFGTSPVEVDQQDLSEVPKGATALRIDLECLLADHVEPAIRELDELIVFCGSLPARGLFEARLDTGEGSPA